GREIVDLIDLFSKIQYRAKEVSPRVDAVEKRCLELFGRDYKYSVIHNTNGEVCGHYPRQIVYLEYECMDSQRDRFQSSVQISKLQDLVNRSKLARCRGRFVCPVILFNGKHICRSSTLAGWGELYGRTGYNYIFSGGSDDTWTEQDEVLEEDSAARNSESQLFDKVRGHDIKLLRYLSVRYICDLMVENKKVKFGLNVTSSEKVDKAQRYADFTLLSVPYPGCEFFKDYKDRDYMADGLVFNWNQDYVDAPLTIPTCFTPNLNIDWTEYQSWDLVVQTQNYLKLLLHIINSDDESGLLVHCISGWDRTPLFVSLLRLSLWADGAVHASLQPAEILYLTIAYDWFLFGYARTHRQTDSSAWCSTRRAAQGLMNQKKGPTSSPQTMVWSKPPHLEDHLYHPLGEARSSSSSSSNQSEQGITRAGSSPLAVPGRRLAAEYPRSGSSLSTDYGSWQIVSGCGSIHDHGHFMPPASASSTSSCADEGPSGRMCGFLSERQARLEAVRELFLAAYSSTVGLKSSAPSPSGAISGLLEQFARGVGLRGTNNIV
uniref:Myotubularin related protein 14 n=1 Tax=Gadus morhua TaxID=8049 RepID=A0A8C5BJ81_GADMO